METLEHLSGVWLHYFVLPPYTEREKNHLNIANNAFADGGNRTRAACTASECAIHYSIASRLNKSIAQGSKSLILKKAESRLELEDNRFYKTNAWA